MKLRCGIEIYDRTLSTCLYRRVRFHAILAFARKLVEDGVYLYLPNERHNFQTGYQIVNNIQQVFKIDNGKIKIGLIRPCHDLTIESDMNKLKSFLRVLDHIRYSQSPYNDPVIKQNAPITDFLSYNSKKCSLGQVKVKVMVKEKSEYPTSQGFPRATEQLILRNLDSESFDRQILHLQNLRILDLSNNKISYLPKEVGTLPHLQQLLLSRNNLGNTLGSKWTWLEQTAIRHNLQFLDISSNAVQHLEENLTAKNNHPFKLEPHGKVTISKLLYKFRSKWQEASRNLNTFLHQQENWLNRSIYLPNAFASKISSMSKFGRPFMEFTTASERSKRRRTSEMHTKYSTEELAYATQMKLRSSGNLDAANIVKEMTTSSPTRASKEVFQATKARVSNRAISMSYDAALSVIVETKLTRNQYSVIRQSMKEHNCNLYPSYHKVLQAKVRCYPPRSDVTITETSAEVKLQALLNHTAERILLVQNDVIKSLLQKTVHMNLICKWGCDGSSGQSEYKQKFADENSSDANVFLTSLVPLQLLSIDYESNSKIVIWKNPRPSSPRFCRPIRLQFLHENVQSTVNEKHYIEEQIKSLVPFYTVVDGKEILITYDMLFTMID